MFPRCNLNDILSPGQTCYVDTACKDICADEETTVLEKNGLSASFCAKGELVHLYSDMDVLQGNYIEFMQDDSLEEISKEGKVVRNINLSGNNSWSPVNLRDGIFTSSYSATEEIKANPDNRLPVILKKTVYFGILTSSTVESVQCPACLVGTSGTCQNARTKACADPNVTSGFCPRRFSPCTETVIVNKPTVAISLELTNFNFQDPANKLRYRTNLKIKEDKHFFPSLNVGEVVFTGSGGFLTAPVTAVIVSPDGSKAVIDIDVTLNNTIDNELGYEISIDAYPDGKILYYN